MASASMVFNLAHCSFAHVAAISPPHPAWCGLWRRRPVALDTQGLQRLWKRELVGEHQEVDHVAAGMTP